MATKVNADLFGDVELETARVRVTRTKVDVPAAVLKTLKEIQGAGKRAIWPVRDFNHYDTMADVFYSAGELLQASVIAAPVKRNDKDEFEAVKRDPENWTATHVRVTVTKRRGRKTPATPDSE